MLRDYQRRSIVLAATLSAIIPVASPAQQSDQSDPRQTLAQEMSDIQQTAIRESCNAYTQVIANQFGTSLEKALSDAQNTYGDDSGGNTPQISTSTREQALMDIRNTNPFADMGNDPVSNYLKGSYEAINKTTPKGERPNLDSFMTDCMRKMPRLMDMTDQSTRQQQSGGNPAPSGQQGRGGQQEPASEDTNEKFRYLRR